MARSRAVSLTMRSVLPEAHRSRCSLGHAPRLLCADHLVIRGISDLLSGKDKLSDDYGSQSPIP